MKKTSLGLVCVVLLTASLAGATSLLRYQTDQRGSFILIGNTVGFDCGPGVPAPTNGNTAACASTTNTADTAIDLWWRAGLPPGSATAGLSPVVTNANARSATVLTLPVGAQVTYARLYWSAENTTLTQGANVTFEAPGAPPQYLVSDANNLLTEPATGEFFYQSSKDVTSLVQTYGSGTYRVGSFASIDPNGRNDQIQYMGWSMVVVYANSAEPPRNITIFDGLDVVNAGGNIITDNISGFLVPNQAGFDATLGLVAYEGDNQVTGDSFAVNGGNISNAYNPVNNFFNSTHTALNSSRAATLVSNANDSPQLTGAPESMGSFDIDVVDITSNVHAGDTNATLRATTTSDTYFFGVIAVAISTFKPDFSNLGKTAVNLSEGSATVPNDVLQYTISFSNTGSDTAIQTVLTDTLPSGLTYVPNSIKIIQGYNAGAITDAIDTDTGQYSSASSTITVYIGKGATATSGGNITTSDQPTVVQFLATVNGTSNAIANSAYVTSKGQKAAGQGIGSVTYPSGNGVSPSSPTITTVDGCAASSNCPGSAPHCNTSVSPHVCDGCVSNSDCSAPATCGVNTCIFTTAPVIVSPANNSNVTSTTPSISGTAMAGASVSVTIDGTSVGSTFADSSGNWLYDTNRTLTAGNHNVVVTELAGSAALNSNNSQFKIILNCLSDANCSGGTPHCNTSTKSCVGCTSPAQCINSTCNALGVCAVAAPVITVPTNNSVLASQTPAISGTAGGLSGVTIEVLADSAVLGTTTTNASGNWNFTAPTLPYGNHSFTALIVLGSGSTEVISSSSNAVNVILGNCLVSGDCSSPNVCDANYLCARCQSTADCPTGATCAANSCYVAPPTVDSPTNGELLSNGNTTYSGWAPANSTVTVNVDGATFATVTANSSGLWTTVLTSVPVGQHAVYAAASFGSGINAVSSGASSTNSFQVINGCLSSSDCSAATPVCNTYLKACVQCLSTADCPSPANCNVPINTCYITTPAITFPTPALITSVPSPTISGTADANVNLAVYIDNVLQGNTFTTGSTWTFTLAQSLSQGSHTVYAVAAAGTAPDLVTATSASVVFVEGCVNDGNCLATPATPHCRTTDGTCVACTSVAQCPMGATACTANTCIVSSPNILVPSNNGITNTSPVFSGNSIANANVTLTLTGPFNATLTATALNGNWTVSPSSSLPLGNYTLTATTTLGSGATAAISGPSATVSFQVVACVSSGDCSGSAPVCNPSGHSCVRCTGNANCPIPSQCLANACVVASPNIVVPANNGLTNAQPFYAGTTAANANVSITVDGVMYGPVKADSGGNWILQPSVTVSLGNHNVIAVATLGSGALAVTSAPSSTTNFMAVACLTASDCGGATPVCSSSYQCAQCAVDANCVAMTHCVSGSCSFAAPPIIYPTAGGYTNSTPTINGNTLAGATVSLAISGQSSAVVLADGSGNWNYKVPSSLAVGSYTVTAYATLGANPNWAVSPNTVVTWSVVACVGNNDCGSGAAPVCDSSSHACVFCASNSDCGGATPACNGGMTACVRCAQAGDCPLSLACANANCVLPAPIFTSPDPNSVISTAIPLLTGTGIAGGNVTILLDGVDVATVPVLGSGSWSYRVTPALSVDAHTAVATETVGSGQLAVTSSNSNTLTFYVVCTGDFGTTASSACADVTSPFCSQGKCGVCTGTASCVGHGGPICNSVTGQCGSACGADADCSSGLWCSAGSCVAKVPNGQPLPNLTPVNGICTVANSGHACISGVCDVASNLCGLANGATCDASPLCQSAVCYPDGACGLPNTSACQNANQCRSLVCYADGLCGEPLGDTCANGNVCRSNSCDAGVCTAGCNGSAQCAANYYCDSLSATCLAALPNGDSCGANYQCSSEVCYSDGSCGVPLGGSCSGELSCRVGSCVGGVCSNHCAVDSDCQSGQFCSSQTCTAGFANGVACAEGAQCLSGLCAVDGLCGSPDGQACTTPSTCRSGVCGANVCQQACLVDTACLNTQFCNTQDGNCETLLVNGQSCQRNAQCTAYVCQQGQCGQAAGFACNSNTLCQSGACGSDGLCGAVLGATCSANAACRTGLCVDGVCGGCAQDSQCGAGQSCVSGACAANLNAFGFAGGGGCQALGFGDFAWLASLLLLLRTAWRRRARYWAIGLAMFFAAQSVAEAATNQYNLERYTPTTPGEWSFWVDKPWYAEGLDFFSAGVTLDYGHRPLVVGSRNLQTGQLSNTTAVISQQLVGYLEVAGSFLDRVTLAADVPFILKETGTAAFGVTPLSSPTLSDPKVSAMVRLIGHSLRDPFSLHVGGSLWLPLGQAGLATNSSARGLPKIVVSGALFDHILYSAFVGVLLRGSASAGTLPSNAGNSVGSEAQLAASVSWADLDERYAVGPELIYSTNITASGKAFGGFYSSLEVLLGANYRPIEHFQVGAAVGAGLLQEPGTPDLRALLRVAYTPSCAPPVPPPDTDGDGIVDSLDACPSVKGVDSADPNVRGCPRDSDGDGVIDTLDQCIHEPAGPTPDPHRPGCPFLDSDHDGVADGNDLCPHEPAGANPDPNKIGCPDRDRDHDGVFDAVDLCPDVPQGPVADANRKGCPVADRDHDTVSDDQDHCPDVPGAPDPDPEKNGCPGLVKINGDRIETEPLYFANGQDRILPKSFPAMQALIKVLARTPAIKLVSVEGHTDNQGKAARNLDLSARRAKQVVEYMVEHGIEASRLESHGFGDSKPITSNSTAKGRAINRRVEFKIID